jgi:hypothetical protein
MCFSGHSSNRIVKMMVIQWAKATEDERASAKTPDQGIIATKECPQVPASTFEEYPILPPNIFPCQMTPIRGKDHRIGIRIDGSDTFLKLPAEKVVEGTKFLNPQAKLGDIDPVILDEGLNPLR